MIHQFIVSVLAVAIVITIGVPESIGAAPARRRPFDPNPRTEVVGAFWKATAVNSKTGEKREFMYRAKDGVLYNKGKAVGNIKPIQKGESKVTLGDPLPLQGELKIKLIKPGLWKGTLIDTNGASWNCKLDVVDR